MCLLQGIVNSDRVINEPEQPPLSTLTSVSHTPLLENNNVVFTDTSTPTLEEDPCFPTHINIDVKVSDEEDPGEIMEDSDSGGFNSGNSFSGYDSHKFPIDMGQGDIVEGYGPR